MLARVSTLESYRQWRNDEETSVEDFIARLTAPATPPMLAGTAFHKALETAPDGEHETLSANGYTFHLPDSDIFIPKIRELRGFKKYGALEVTGCVDAMDGHHLHDHKTTSRFDPDRFLSGYQWRFYLDIFGANVFRWNVFEIKETEPNIYRVSPPQFLEQYRYPRMTLDCEQLAADFHAFALEFMPNHKPNLEAA